MGLGGARFRDIRFQHSAPTRFGQKYRDEIAASPRIAACLNANLVDLTLDADLASVTAAHFRSYDPADPGFAVRARVFCLALGGLENPRMLLNFTRQKPQGIGNDHDLVGRHFCEHPSRIVAEARFSHPQAIEEDSLAPTRAFMLERGTLGFTLKVSWRDRPPDPLLRALKSGVECATPGTRRLAERVLGRPSLCRWGGVEEFLARRWPDSHPTGWVWMATEQALNPDSRMMLGDDTDAFGLRRIRFDWRLTDLDYHTMQTAVLTLGEHFAESDLGRIRIHDWLLAEEPRMPKDGSDSCTATSGTAATTRCAPPAWPTARARGWSTATAGCTAPPTSISAARASSAPRASATPPSPSCSWRCGSATIWRRSAWPARPARGPRRERCVNPLCRRGARAEENVARIPGGAVQSAANIGGAA